MQKKISACVMLALLFVLGLTFIKPAQAEENYAKELTIPDGVYIGEINVSGMTEEEAEKAVDDFISAREDAVLSISFNGDASEISMKELSFTWKNSDVVEEAIGLGNTGNLLDRYKEQADISNHNVVLELEYSWDTALLQKFLEQEAEERKTDPVEATMVRDRKAKEFVITESVTGLTVDVTATLKEIKSYLEEEWDGGDVELDAVVEVVEPKLTTEMCETVTDILGEYSTPYNAAQTDRSQNLAVGCGYIDGVVLLPGESLSFFDYLYPCTAERGYRTAIAYQNGRYIDSIGGGICQVSTTCYNAVLLAELDVVTRSPHTMTVSYVDPGLDSGQAWSSGRNLTFANNTEYPVYVEAYASGGTVYIGLWGKETRPSNRTIKYYSDYTETWVYNGAVEYTYDASLPYGYESVDQHEYPKVIATAYKEVYVDGVLQSKEALHTDSYKATPTYVTVGTGGLSVEDYLAGVQPASAEESQEESQVENQG
jgi:vancomycin resistance protein YoaR